LKHKAQHNQQKRKKDSLSSTPKSGLTRPADFGGGLLAHIDKPSYFLLFFNISPNCTGSSVIIELTPNACNRFICSA
jgi:hypothetical protein